MEVCPSWGLVLRQSYRRKNSEPQISRTLFFPIPSNGCADIICPHFSVEIVPGDSRGSKKTVG
jgi:hypothetical protein